MPFNLRRSVVRALLPVVPDIGRPFGNEGFSVNFDGEYAVKVDVACREGICFEQAAPYGGPALWLQLRLGRICAAVSPGSYAGAMGVEYLAGGLAGMFRAHFGHREHLYGVLLEDLADDLDAEGPTAWICRDHLGATRAEAIQLRLLAAIFRIVLRGEAPELAAFYPCLGGSLPPDRAWDVLRPLLVTHADELAAGLAVVPQTNEVGRAACLAVGLFAAVRRHGVNRVRLLEPGASAGLNLNVDRYRIHGPGWAWGGEDRAVQLDTQAAGIRPEPVTIVERRGCDLHPVDVSTPDEARYLTSFVWPFDLARHERLAAAIETARSHPVTVDCAPASEWVADQLARPVDPEVLTIVWSSITQQYWPPAETQAVEQAVAQARSRIRLSRITLEGVPPVQMTKGYDIASTGAMLRVDGDVVARAHHHHGVPLLAESPLATL